MAITQFELDVDAVGDFLRTLDRVLMAGKSIEHFLGTAKEELVSIHPHTVGVGAKLARIDAEQDVAKAYHAACTPDFYLFDADRKLVYRGQLDGSRPGNTIPVDSKDLRGAIDAVLAGEAIPEEQVPSIGCSIKWIAGNEPVSTG